MDYVVGNSDSEKIERVVFQTSDNEVEGACCFRSEYFSLFDAEGGKALLFYKDIDKLIEVLNTVKRFKAEGKI